MPYRMTPSVRHRAIEVYYYYYYYYFSICNGDDVRFCMHFTGYDYIFIDFDDSMRRNFTLQSDCTITTGNQSRSTLNLVWEPSPSSIWVNFQIKLSSSGVVYTEKLCKITECVVDLPAQSEIQVNIQVARDPHEYINDVTSFSIHFIRLDSDASIQRYPNQPSPSKLINIEYFII